jgi:hypothetical protein
MREIAAANRTSPSVPMSEDERDEQANALSNMLSGLFSGTQG